MPAQILEPYPVYAIGKRSYVDMTDTRNPVTVWTPRGEYVAPNIVKVDKMHSNVTMPLDLVAIKHILPSSRRLTAGEWHQTRRRLERTNPHIEMNMITSPYEATATVVVIWPGKMHDTYCEGLLAEHPEFHEDHLLLDEFGTPIIAKYKEEMALPLRPGGVKELVQKEPNLRAFFQTIYGMGDINTLPDEALFVWPNMGKDLWKPDIPTSDDPHKAIIKNLVCGHGWYDSDIYKRHSTDGRWSPSDSSENVASRAAVTGRIVQDGQVARIEVD